MRILFVCTGNSCRSQMAEGFARAAGAEAYSAGTEPAGNVHPMAVKVMAEVGIDIARQTSKRFDLEFAEIMNAVITVCGETDEACPVIPHTNRMHWPIADPAKATGTEEDILGTFRAVRDDIGRRVKEFIEDKKQGATK